MERPDRKIVLLMDRFDNGSRDLFDSMAAAMPGGLTAVVIEDDGFLPDGVTGVFEYFMEEAGGEDASQGDDHGGRPLFFDRVPVPDYWEISGTNERGTIRDKDLERAAIFYAKPRHRRLVKAVDWKDPSGTVRFTEHYNKRGRMYAVTAFNKKGQKVSKSYFDAARREVIVENYVTSNIILNRGGRTFIFRNRTEFAAYFIREAGLEDARIFFNSLSFPFFVSNALCPGAAKEDILFWQEPVADGIPGNMTFIFNGSAPRCDRVIAQSRSAYERLLQLGAPAEKISELGFIYKFRRENTILEREAVFEETADISAEEATYGSGGSRSVEALVCTNTDNVEKLAELAQELPEVTIHVAAITEMSDRLLSHERFGNVELHPNITPAALEKLFARCSIYLDINHEGEIADAMREAFLNNMLILAFNETLHSDMFTAPENRFAAADHAALAHRLRTLCQGDVPLTRALAAQRSHALAATERNYRDKTG